MASMLDTMESMASPLESKVLPVSTPSTFPFPVPDVNVVMLTPRRRLKPRLLLTTMEVTTAVDTDTPTTDTDTVWAVTTDMDSTIPVLPPTPVPPHLLPDLPKVLASKRSYPAILKKPQSYAKIYALHIQNASNNVPK